MSLPDSEVGFRLIGSKYTISQENKRPKPASSRGSEEGVTGSDTDSPRLRMDLRL